MDKEPEADTPLPHVRRATSHSSWTGGALARHLPASMRGVLARYGLASALAGSALLIRGALPVPEGTSIYQLPIVAVVMSAWFGGRGPGLFAALICATAILYRFVPPANSFELPSEYALGFFIFIALSLLLSEFSAGRRRAVHALRASEERFHALVQFSFDVYWETDAKHRFTRQEFSDRLTEAPAPGAEIGKTRWEIPYVEPDEETWRKHRATLNAHLPFRDFELARPTPDGGTRYVSVSGIPAFDEIGRFIGYRGVGRHITERKRAEAEHRSYLKFLESMDRINRAMQGTQDLQQMLSDVTLATLDIFGCDRAWLIYPCDPDASSWHAVMEHTRPEFPGAFALQAEFRVDRDVAAAFAAARSAPGAVLFGPDYDLKIPALAAERFAIRSQMAMAIDAKADKPYLFGLHQCSRARLWTAEEQRLFQEIGRRLSDAISALSTLRSLRDSERKLDAAQRIAHVGWWERDFGTNRVALSEEVQRIFGVRPVDLPHWQDRWTDLIHPHDRARAVEAAAAAAVRGAPRYDVEYRVVRSDGTVRVVHSQGDVAWDDSGRPLRQFGVLQDITELRQSEDELSEVKERFRVLAESSLTGIYLTEQDRFIYVNPALAKMFGYEVEEVVGRASTDLTCPEDRPLVAENMRRRLRGDVEEMRYEFRGLRKDGSVFPVEVHGRRIEHGGRIGVLGTLIDNTERQRAEDALQMARTELARVSRLTTLGELTTSIAHEVSQPLGAMVASAGACARWLAADPPAMAEARSALDNIVSDGKRAREIIARIRALAKRQAPRMELLDLNRKILEMLALTEQELRSHDILLETKLDSALPPVTGDRVQLQQVLLNLIVNAIEAMSATVTDRPRELTIVSAQDTNGVVVEVRDSGIGFDPHGAERVFEAFYTTKTEGIGIGLSISRSIVEAHGGQLLATPNEPHGAVFRFSLPVAKDPQS
jgi:PAS domain S-box-containing protein